MFKIIFLLFSAGAAIHDSHVTDEGCLSCCVEELKTLHNLGPRELDQQHLATSGHLRIWTTCVSLHVRGCEEHKQFEAGSERPH